MKAESNDNIYKRFKAKGKDGEKARWFLVCLDHMLNVWSQLWSTVWRQQDLQKVGLSGRKSAPWGCAP